MSIRGNISYLDSPTHTMRKWAEAHKKGLEAAAKFWHRAIMPEHFTVAGGKKYGYQKRSGEGENQYVPKAFGIGKHLRFRMVKNRKYYWRKMDRVGHGVPLVYSGDSERMAKSAVKLSSKKTRAGQIQGIAAMTLPKYFYQYLKAGTYVRQRFRETTTMTVSHTTPNKAEELTRSTPTEEAALAEVARRNSIRFLNSGGKKPEKKTAA